MPKMKIPLLLLTLSPDRGYLHLEPANNSKNLKILRLQLR